MWVTPATGLLLCASIFLLGCQPALAASKGIDKNRPRNVEVEILNATTVDVKWQPPRHVTPSCPIRRFLIRLKSEGDKNAKRWRIDGARLSLTLHDLVGGTTYYIRVVAFTCRGKSAPSRWTKVAAFDTIQDDAASVNYTETEPPGKPTNVRTRTFSDSVILSWFAPTEPIIVRGYMVGYGEGVPDVNWQYVDGDTRNMTILNLKSATQYVISLRAFNNFGKGPVIYDLIYTRDQSGPTVGPFSPPTNIKAKVLSPTTAWLQWSDPTLGRHQQITDSRYYNVHFQAMPNGKTMSLIVKGLTVVLYDLTPGTDYSFKVRTVKDAFSSPFSLSIHNRTFEEVPGSPPRSLSAEAGNETSSVRLNWRPPRQPNGVIHGYIVLWTTTRSMPEEDWAVISVMDGNTETFIKNLEADTTYYYQVQARNSKGYSPRSQTIVYKVPSGSREKDSEEEEEEEEEETGQPPGSPPRGFYAEQGSDVTSIKLRWSSPRRPNGKIEGYMVFWTTTRSLRQSDWESVAVTKPDITEMVIDDLQEGTSYYFRVQARNGRGYGPMSQIIVYRVPRSSSHSEERHTDSEESDTSDEESGESMLKPSTTVSPISVEAAERLQEGQPGTPAALRSGTGSTWYMEDQDAAVDTSQWNLASQVHVTASAVVTWSSQCRQQQQHVNAPPQSYVVQYNVVGAPHSSAINVTVTGMNLVLLQDLAANQQYSYRVLGVYANGTQTSWSSTSTFHTNYTHTQSSYSLG